MRPKELVPVLTRLIQHKHPFLLVGKPGVGKTDITEQAATAAGADLLIRHPVVDEPIDYKGLPIFHEGKASFVPYDTLQVLMDTQKLTLVFLDDFGQANPSVQAAAMQLVLARAINGHKISDQVVFAAATNDRSHMAAVGGIIEPMKSRFHTIIHVEVNKDDWTDWAMKNNLPMSLISFVHWRPKMLDSFDPTPNMTNSPTPRTLYNASLILQEDFPEEVRFELLSGAAGEGFATEFEGFLRIAGRVPDPQLALKNPKRISNFPTKPDSMYAFIGALIEYLEMPLLDNFCTILEKFPPEFRIVAMTLATKKIPEIHEHPAWLKWMEANADFIYD